MTVGTGRGGQRGLAGAASFPKGFDDHRPPERELVRDCVHCGFCLPTCPTYVVWGEEMDSPRGRIHLMEQVLDGAELGPAAVEHFDRCLSCMACVTACPSGVQYDKLIEATRAQVERRAPGAAPSGRRGAPSSPSSPIRGACGWRVLRSPLRSAAGCGPSCARRSEHGSCPGRCGGWRRSPRVAARSSASLGTSGRRGPGEGPSGS